MGVACQPTSCLAGHARRRPLKQGGFWVGKVQIKQLGQCLMWPLWLSHGIEARVVMLSVCIGQAVYSCPLGRHQMTVLEIIIAVLHNPRTDGVLAFVCLCTVAVNSVCASEQCTYETCHSTTEKRETSLALVYKVRYYAYSVTYFHSEIQGRPCIRAVDMNGASQQPSSCQNRCPEAANDAVIARKLRATALMAAQCVYALTRVRPGNSQTHSAFVVAWIFRHDAINLITGDTFWKSVTGWKPIYQLIGYLFNKPIRDIHVM